MNQKKISVIYFTSSTKSCKSFELIKCSDQKYRQMNANSKNANSWINEVLNVNCIQVLIAINWLTRSEKSILRVFIFIVHSVNFALKKQIQHPVVGLFFNSSRDTQNIRKHASWNTFGWYINKFDLSIIDLLWRIQCWESC